MGQNAWKQYTSTIVQQKWIHSLMGAVAAGGALYHPTVLAALMPLYLVLRETEKITDKLESEFQDVLRGLKYDDPELIDEDAS